MLCACYCEDTIAIFLDLSFYHCSRRSISYDICEKTAQKKVVQLIDAVNGKSSTINICGFCGNNNLKLKVALKTSP